MKSLLYLRSLITVEENFSELINLFFKPAKEDNYPDSEKLDYVIRVECSYDPTQYDFEIISFHDFLNKKLSTITQASINEILLSDKNPSTFHKYLKELERLLNLSDHIEPRFKVVFQTHIDNIKEGIGCKPKPKSAINSAPTSFKYKGGSEHQKKLRTALESMCNSISLFQNKDTDIANFIKLLKAEDYQDSGITIRLDCETGQFAYLVGILRDTKMHFRKFTDVGIGKSKAFESLDGTCINASNLSSSREQYQNFSEKIELIKAALSDLP
ncbi:MAG: hypothetical protein JXQ96_17630 [Cyclobacteriaceae bacterium]